MSAEVSISIDQVIPTEFNLPAVIGNSGLLTDAAKHSNWSFSRVRKNEAGLTHQRWTYSAHHVGDETQRCGKV